MANISDIDNCSPLGLVARVARRRSARFSFQRLPYSRAMTREARSHVPISTRRENSIRFAGSFAILFNRARTFRTRLELHLACSSALACRVPPSSSSSPSPSSSSLSLVARGYKFDWHELVAARPLRDAAATSVISRAEYFGRFDSR